MAKQMTFGVIVGNRGFFPTTWPKRAAKRCSRVLEAAGIRAIALTPEESKFGAVETPTEARLCGDLFRKHRDEIDGVIVTLPNFGEERGIVDAMRLLHAEGAGAGAGHAGPTADMKISAPPRQLLRQDVGLQQPDAVRHSVLAHRAAHRAPDSDEFRKDLAWFSAVCRVVRGLRNLRIGAIGARPAAFNTVRYSEKLLERSGISVETLDLSEVFGRIERLKDNDDAVQAKLAAIQKYVSTNDIPEAALIKMSKLGVVIEQWMKQTYCTVSAIQCWTSLEEYFGVVPCTVMSMMSENLFPSACEVDICGTISMHALALASETPSALLDWNNNYGDDPDKCVCFHCSNLPKHFFEDVVMDFQAIIAGTVGKENTFGTCVGRVKAGAMSYVRFSTDDFHGKIRGYVGEGEFTNDPLETFGGAGVVKIPRLQKLLRYICEQGFEHHVAANFSQVGERGVRSGDALSGLGACTNHDQPEQA